MKPIWSRVMLLCVVSLCVACADVNPRSTLADASTLEVFARGQASLPCSDASCSFNRGLDDQHFQHLYTTSQWRELALEVLRVGVGDNATWFFLGRAADGLGFPDAAQRYYEMSLQARASFNEEEIRQLGLPQVVEARLRAGPRPSASSSASSGRTGSSPAPSSGANVSAQAPPPAPRPTKPLSTEPVLRIETGIHTGSISQIGVDAANRYLVTGSQDKTIRVWDLATGKLLQILRPPIGEDNEGRISALAISPDGNTIAGGGSTGFQWDGTASIYLFERANGRLARRITIPAIRGNVARFAYSRDGQFLAILFGLKDGIRIYRTSDWTQVAEDKDYGDSCIGLDFDRTGRLVTVSMDGFVRLYDANFRLLIKQQPPGGPKPVSPRFSPDSTKIAVGFQRSTNVNVLSGQDLSFLFAPDTTGAWTGEIPSFSNLAWSLDGRTLYAGGAARVGDVFFIRKWDDGGRGRPSDLKAAEGNSIGHMRPLNDGGLVYAAVSIFGILDAQGRRVLYQDQAIADHDENLAGFLVSHDGMRVQFAYEFGGKSPARFSVPDRLLEHNPSASSALVAPITEASGFSLTDWKKSESPKFNGRSWSTKTGKGEIFTSLAIAPDQERHILGSGWYLRCFDRTGKILWQKSPPSAVMAVNIAGNGQVVVAALSNGTIRWYRMSDGQELLAFFPHADKKRWVLWTPSGYYDASAGAEQLVGWRVNRGVDQTGDFFPVGQFRNTYYRPDIVAKVLETLDEGGAVRAANADSGRKEASIMVAGQFPPVVMILSPAEGTEVSAAEVTVKVSVRSSSPVTGLKALVDGRPMATERGVKVEAGAGSGSADGTTRELRVTIPPHDVEVAIIAENQYAASTPATVQLKWKGAAPKDEVVIKPKLYVLAVGVSQYQMADLRLGFAAKDAQDFAAVLKKQEGGLYREVATKVLTDAKATRDDIMDGLDWLQRQTTSRDVAIMFLAGHGVNDSSGIYYYLPVNADPEKLKRTGVVFSDIKNTISSLAGKTVAFIDTCHSGNVMGTRRGSTDITGVVNELASAESGVVVFASSTGKQYSMEDAAWGNGAFTKALVEGLGGKADLIGKGKITVTLLEAYIAERVKELTKGKQTPTTTKPQTIQDFPVALKR